MQSYFQEQSAQKNSASSASTTVPKLPPRIRLKIVNQFFPPDYAPTGQLIEELAHKLKDDFGPIEVFTSQPSYAFESNTSPRWEHYKGLIIRRSQASRLWPRRIRGKAADGVIFFIRAAINLLKHRRRRELVLLTTAPPFLPFLGYLLSRVCKIRYVCLLYDLYPDIAVELNVLRKHIWLAKFWDACNRLAWRNSAGVIVLNDSAKALIAKKEPSIAHKITVIPSWADPYSIKPIPKSKNWFAQQHQLDQKFTVLYSGNMGRCHDIKTLLNAIILLQDRPIQFVFIGSGAKRQHLIEEVKRLDLKNCLFLPYQARADLPFSLTACDLSIVSIQEGMEGLVVPSKFYSALASGRPVAAICESHSYLTRLVKEANCGSAFLNGDSEGLAAYIDHLSRNPRLAEKLGDSGRDFCLQNYTLEKVAQQYFQMFEGLSTEKRTA